MPEIKVSKAARELAEALFPDFTPEIHVEYANIIQSHVRDLLEKAHMTTQCSNDGACSNCIEDLAKALEPWKAGE